LAATLTGANSHDVTQLVPLVEAIPPVRGKPGRPRRRPERVQGTVRTIPSRIVGNCDSEESSRFWRNETLNMAAGWESIVGWSKERSVGYINSGDYELVTIAATTFTKHS